MTLAVCYILLGTVPDASFLSYLGTVLSPDGSCDRELSRRIGAAKADFLALHRVWTQSAMTRVKKLALFSSLIESKLFYSLSSLCLTAAQLRRLDGFQNRCVRKIFGIPPAFVSRISNHSVLQQACHPAASLTLRKRSLIFFGKVLRAPEGHPLRLACFIPGTLWPATEQFVRRVGRPRKEWTKEALAESVRLFGSLDAACTAAQDKFEWDRQIQQRLVS